MTLKEYTVQYQLYAKGLAAEGWSQTAIAKELRVPRESVRDWLKNGHSQIGELRQPADNGETRLAPKTSYHISNCPAGGVSTTRWGNLPTHHR